MEVAASVIAIIQMAKTVGAICGSYIGRYRDAPKDLRSIVIEASSVKSVLEVIQLLLNHSAGTNSSLREQMTGQDGPLPACLSILQELSSLFPKEERVVNGERKVFLGHLERLGWPSKASKAQRLLTDLGKLKSTLRLMLTSDAVVDIKEVKTNIYQIQHRLSEKEKEDILKRLVTTDPSPNHNSAAELREPQTGTWLLRSEEYATWLTGPVQLFWIHGIPGAGKTVLLSFLALAMQDHCRKDGNAGMASCYYYCYFGRSQDETPHLLRWAISQLCRQSGGVPDEVVQLFKAGTEPALAALMSAFSAVARSFTMVFLLVDALDETQDQTRLVSTLSCLAGPGFPNVKVLATSRKEPDIERILQKEQSMSLLNPLVDEDIRLYIHEALTSDDRFRGWRPSLVSAVEDSLISGAKGMFRWVACQLDILRRLSTESAIRKALYNLPETLDETYERILISIPDFNRDFAKRALQWLSYPRIGPGVFSCAVLAVAVTMPCQDGDLDLEDQLVDVAKLQDICTCLADIPEEDHDDRGTYSEPRLSHYTVKEFLISDRIQHGPASEFFTSHKSSLILFAKTLIPFLLHFDPVTIGYNQNPAMYSWERFPSPASDDSDRITLLNMSRFYQFAIVAWPDYLRQLDNEGCNQEAVFDLLFELFDPRRFGFEALRISANTEWGDGAVLPDWIANDENWAIIVLLNLVHIGLLEAAKEWLRRNESLNVNNPHVKRENYYGADNEEDCPLLLALTHKSVDLIRYCILEGRVDYDSRDDDDMVCPMGLIVGSPLESDDICDLVRLMIRFGAEANPKDVCFTPLQIAVGYGPSRSLDVIQLLLECRADSNATGSLEFDVYASRYCSYCDGTPLELAREAARTGGDNNQEQMAKVIDLLLRFGARPEESPMNSSQSREGSDEEAMESLSLMEIEDGTEKELDEEMGNNGVP